MAFSTVTPYPQKVDRKNIAAWLAKQPRARKVVMLVWHHTYRPTVKQWTGAKHMVNLREFYKAKNPPWSAGPHFFVAPDGIWPMTPINVTGIHAGVGNTASIGIEIVGDYDAALWSGEVLANAIALGKALHALYKLPFNAKTVRLHREFSKKTCPGKKITQAWILQQLTKAPTKPTVAPVTPKPVPVPPKPVAPPISQPVAPGTSTEPTHDTDSVIATILGWIANFLKKIFSR